MHCRVWRATRLARTVEEERAREKAIDFYNYVGKTDIEAERLAWADVQKTCPRLRAYCNTREIAE